MSDHGGFLDQSGGEIGAFSEPHLHRLIQLHAEKARLIYESRLLEKREAENEAAIHRAIMELDGCLWVEKDGEA